MKKLLMLVLFASLILISSCSNKYIGNSVVNTIPATSTAAPTIPKEVTTIFSSNPDTCPKQFLRKQILPDGSVKEYCLPPEYFRLAPCRSDKDCSEVESCLNGYCIIHDEDVTS